MPSIVSVEQTTTMQTVANESAASTTLKALLENPLRFEKAGGNIGTSISGRYTPLNRPFQLDKGTVNGVRRLNGTVSTTRSVSMGSSEDTDEEGEEKVNGTSKLVAAKPVAVAKDVISTEWLREFRRPPGLRNFSNTCYMNSTLQALMHVPPLVSFFLQRGHTLHCNKGPRVCIACRLERHAKDSYLDVAARSAIIEPHGIVGKTGVLPKFHNVHKQEDAHELFIHLLDKMDEAEKKAHRDPKLKSIIPKIFGGECRQSITCTNDDCGHVSHTSQVFMDLSLDLLMRDRDILSSLQDFTRQETLSHDNQYKCEKCKSKSRAKKTTRIHSTPPILTIHLKRFSATGMRKNTKFFEYPELLDLNPYMSEESRGIAKYRLIATVCHHGFDLSGMSSGHYTANCKSSSGVWNNFDDTRIEKIGLHQVLRDRDAYILFYARDDAGGIGGTPKRKADSAFAEDMPSSSSPKKMRNGLEKMNGSSPLNPQRTLDDDDSRPKSSPQPSREPLKSMPNGNLTTQPSKFQQTYVQSPNGLNRKPSPKSPKRQAPQVIRGAGTSFFKDLNTHNHTQSPTSNDDKPAQPRPTTKHTPKPLKTTSINPYAYTDKDPFYHGAMHSQQRRAPKYPGIQSAIQPGANKAFMDNTAARRDEFGIKIAKTKRKDAMRK